MPGTSLLSLEPDVPAVVASRCQPRPSVELGPEMRAVYEQAMVAARAPISVLLLGETGVGKEVLARTIHAGSPRANGRFVAINCAALSDSLLESELFGHEKGAFTGALSAREGLFESAAGGTVFLDEVGEMPLRTQIKLLRVIEEREVTRLGSTRPRSIDVRFLSATNRELERDCQTGAFRSDLYFRLAGMALTVPPLRERRQEIEPLARKLLAAACARMARETPPTLSREALDLLRGHSWPGNVRELRNAIERAAVLCSGGTIQPADLPPFLGRPAMALSPRPALAPSDPPPDPPPAPNLAHEIKSLERARIVEALWASANNQTRAAARLGISRRTLVSRLEEFDLPRPRKRPGT